jgi:hypothetical protein
MFEILEMQVTLLACRQYAVPPSGNLTYLLPLHKLCLSGIALASPEFFFINETQAQSRPDVRLQFARMYFFLRMEQGNVQVAIFLSFVERTTL